MSTSELLPHEIAIRIATAMGWKLDTDYYVTADYVFGVSDSIVIRCGLSVKEAAVWSPAESTHDAIDLLQALAEKGYGYVINCSYSEPIVSVFKGGWGGKVSDPSLPRAISLAVMQALEAQVK